MTKSKLALSSRTYKNHILAGFSRLQQSDEFVDMTLAAEGHLVKVHQTIVALASPYLRELIRSVPCQHPVIFLNGVSHEVLSSILEYIYTGEVQIPAEKVPSFLKITQALHIEGLKNINPFANKNESSNEEKQTTHIYIPEQALPPLNDSIAISNENNNIQMQEPIIDIPDTDTENQTNQELPINIHEPTLSTLEPLFSEQNMIQNTNMISHGKNINLVLNDNVIRNDISQKPVAKIEILSNTLLPTSKTIDKTSETMNNQYNLVQWPQIYTQGRVNMKNQDETNISMNASTNNQIDLSKLINMGGKLLLPQYTTTEDIIMTDLLECDNDATESTNVNNTEEINETANKTGTIVYTISNRGALQMILDNFMYYCHYQRDNGRKRRWRCIEYRDSQCRAAIDTDGEQIEARKHEHCHPNHAIKIKKKVMKSGNIFSTIQKAEDITKKPPPSTIADDDPVWLEAEGK